MNWDEMMGWGGFVDAVVGLIFRYKTQTFCSYESQDMIHLGRCNVARKLILVA